MAKISFGFPSVFETLSTPVSYFGFTTHVTKESLTRDGQESPLTPNNKNIRGTSSLFHLKFFIGLSVCIHE